MQHEHQRSRLERIVTGRYPQEVRAHAPVDDDDPGTPGPCPVDSVGSAETTIQHGVGLRTGLETDAGRWGPVVFSVFLDAQLYYLLGDLSTDFGATTPNGSASFAFDSDPLVFQASAGLRFNWNGF